MPRVPVSAGNAPKAVQYGVHDAEPSSDTQSRSAAPTRERNDYDASFQGRPETVEERVSHDRKAPDYQDTAAQQALRATPRSVSDTSIRTEHKTRAFNKVLAAVVKNNRDAGNNETTPNTPDSQGQVSDNDAVAKLAILNALSFLAMNRNPAMQSDADNQNVLTSADLAQLQNMLSGSDASKLSELAALLAGAGNMPADNTAVATQATDVIKQALTAIADALNVKSVSALSDLNTIAPTDENAVQFAEILAALKALSGQLDNAASQTQSLDIGRTMIQAGQVKPLAQLLHSEIFAIEVALKALNLAKPVAEKLAQLQAAPPGASEIIMATSPDKQSMPLYQAQQIVPAQGPAANDNSMSELLQKLAALLQKNNAANAQDPAAASGQTDPDGNTNTAAKPVIASFDATVYRALLKIQTTDSLVSENVDASKDPKGLNLLKEGAILIAQTPAEQNAGQQPAGQLFQNLLHTEPVSQIVKAPDPPARTPEDSVITQIADKLQNAVRNGVMEVRLTLRPESLGEVHIKIRMDGDIVSTRINVENQNVKQIVESNLQHLKDSLSQQNLQSGAFDVTVSSSAHDRLQWETGQQPDTQNRLNADTVNNSGARDTAGAQEFVADGVDTGRRFGNNTVEFYV